jgi:NTE family protein
MLAEFNPDILIGVNTADETETPADGNFLSQLKSMIQQAQDFDKIRENDILIKPEFSAISTLDFNAAKTAIDSGYQAALRCMSAIKQKTSNRTDIETIKQARRRFRGQPDSINVRTIASTGLTQEQSDYVNASLNPFHRTLSIQQLKRNWHRLTRDQNFEYIYPILRTTEKSDSTALLIQARSNRGLDIDFGGIVSSRPVNTGFVSARHRFWAQQSLTIHGNLYFGKLYNSALLGMRLDIPGRLPLQVEPFAIISRYDFYKSSSTFFSDLKPSFLIQQEQLYGMTLATPLRNAGKLSIAIQSFNRKDKYYLTRIFSEADTSDLTKLSGFAVSLNAQRNTLNRKMYPNKGQLLRLDLRGFLADELTIPGSTGIITDSTSAIHRWLQLNARIDQYIAYRSWLRFGYLAEFQFSGMPFLSNQSATASLAPAFQPITEMQTLYLSPFRAHNYLGAGARCIFLLKEDLDVRTEAYVFQPFQEILATQDLKATYGDPFSKRYFAASVNTVYQSPAGPISLAVNYINGREKPLSIMFHLGYLLFNRRIFQD